MDPADDACFHAWFERRPFRDLVSTVRFRN
jgi:hypothetical protein